MFINFNIFYQCGCKACFTMFFIMYIYSYTENCTLKKGKIKYFFFEMKIIYLIYGISLPYSLDHCIR